MATHRATPGSEQGIAFLGNVHQLSLTRGGKLYTFSIVDMLEAIRKLPDESWLKRFAFNAAILRGQDRDLVVYQPVIEKIRWSEAHGGPGNRKEVNSTSGRLLMVQAALQWKKGQYNHGTKMLCMIEDPDETDHVEMFHGKQLEGLGAKMVEVRHEDKLIKYSPEAGTLYFDAQVEYSDDEK